MFSHGSKLLSSGDRVGWLTAAGQYLEFSLAGNEIDRFEAPAYQPVKLNGFVLTPSFYLALGENNEVVAQVAPVGPGPISFLWRLNRGARQWMPVTVGGEQISNNGWLLGFEGDELIVDALTSNRGELVARFSFSPGGCISDGFEF